ncbi:hypothetical protein HDU67_000352 [Dinochytrium kinnereticum]|nr:hypothetical protein HDU67_000352 [Dinochytrium kinnereticum]
MMDKLPRELLTEYIASCLELRDRISLCQTSSRLRDGLFPTLFETLDADETSLVKFRSLLDLHGRDQLIPMVRTMQIVHPLSESMEKLQGIRAAFAEIASPSLRRLALRGLPFWFLSEATDAIRLCSNLEAISIDISMADEELAEDGLELARVIAGLQHLKILHLYFADDAQSPPSALEPFLEALRDSGPMKKLEQLKLKASSGVYARVPSLVMQLVQQHPLLKYLDLEPVADKEFTPLICKLWDDESEKISGLKYLENLTLCNSLVFGNVGYSLRTLDLSFEIFNTSAIPKLEAAFQKSVQNHLWSNLRKLEVKFGTFFFSEDVDERLFYGIRPLFNLLQPESTLEYFSFTFEGSLTWLKDVFESLGPNHHLQQFKISCDFATDALLPLSMFVASCVSLKTLRLKIMEDLTLPDDPHYRKKVFVNFFSPPKLEVAKFAYVNDESQIIEEAVHPEICPNLLELVLGRVGRMTKSNFFRCLGRIIERHSGLKSVKLWDLYNGLEYDIPTALEAFSSYVCKMNRIEPWDFDIKLFTDDRPADKPLKILIMMAKNCSSLRRLRVEVCDIPESLLELLQIAQTCLPGEHPIDLVIDIDAHFPDEKKADIRMLWEHRDLVLFGGRRMQFAVKDLMEEEEEEEEDMIGLDDAL